MSQVVGNTTLAFAKRWRQVDAKDAVLGRLASRIAIMLMGKDKPVFDRSADVGDYVVCTNAKHVVVTGRKAQQKEYWRYSTYPGNTKVIPYRTMMENQPEQIIRHAVSKMLPKNRLRKPRLERLRIYPEEEHPFAQNITRHYDLGPIKEPFSSPVLPSSSSSKPSS